MKPCGAEAMVSKAFSRGGFLGRDPPCSPVEAAPPACKEEGKGFRGFSALNQDFTLVQRDRQNFCEVLGPFLCLQPP